VEIEEESPEQRGARRFVGKAESFGAESCL
jgi:hypothetical protein